MLHIKISLIIMVISQPMNLKDVKMSVVLEEFC